VCGRIAIHSDPVRCVQRFGVEQTVAAGWPRQERYNIHPVDRPGELEGSYVPVIRELEGRRYAHNFLWGPVFKMRDGWKRVINAKLERLQESPLWRQAVKAGRFGIVPADGYYEWEKRASGPKQPYFVRRRDGEPMALPALWGSSPIEPDGAKESTCVIVTTNPRGGIEKIHSRMPLEIPADLFGDWLTGRCDLRELQAVDPTPEWEWWPVSRRVNNPRADGAELIERVEAS